MKPKKDHLPTITAAIAGDEQAFNELVGVYSARLRWLIRLRINPAMRARVSAEDVLQESMLSASQYIQGLVIEAEPAFWSWLCRVVEHRLADAHRKHLLSAGRDARLESRRLGPADASGEMGFDCADPNQSSPSERIRSVEQREALEAALGELTPAQRDVIVLRILEGLSTAEAAVIMDRSPGALSVLLHKSMKRLSGILIRNKTDLDPTQ
ncbi:MAG: sigma-70 family RNA polymerase sigma factor [Planctomycetes bacterium]|nr:sigma-70 family RNA polymerase sigma factor [Planctomycetota bacterium]